MNVLLCFIVGNFPEFISVGFDEARNLLANLPAPDENRRTPSKLRMRYRDVDFGVYFCFGKKFNKKARGLFEIIGIHREVGFQGGLSP